MFGGGGEEDEEEEEGLFGHFRHNLMPQILGGDPMYMRPPNALNWNFNEL